MPEWERRWILTTVMGDHDPYDLPEVEADADLQRAADRFAEESDDQAFEWLMKGPKGRRFIFGLLGRTGVFGSSFSTNAMTMAHNEGQRSVGCWLLGEIKRLCPRDYAQMMQENRK